MSVVNEFESLVDFIQALYPEKTIERQFIPSEPVQDTFYLQFVRTESDLETANRSKQGRTWSLYYVSDHPLDTLTVMEHIDLSIAQCGQTIKIKDTEYFLRVNWFNYTNPFKNENDQTLIIATFRTESRISNVTHEVGKVNKVAFTGDKN